MHPYYLTFWLKLSDSVLRKTSFLESNDLKENLNNNVIVCLLLIREINKYNSAHRSEVVLSQKNRLKSWVGEICTQIFN